MTDPSGPRARTTSLIFTFRIIFLCTILLRTMLALGSWLLTQFPMGYPILEIQSATGGAAWRAHASGFVGGTSSWACGRPLGRWTELLRPG